MPSGSQVTVTCSGPAFPERFSIRLNATSANGNCSSSDSATTDVTVKQRPTIDIKGPKKAVVCPNAEEQTFVYYVNASDLATVNLLVSGSGVQCTAEPTVLGKPQATCAPKLLLLIPLARQTLEAMAVTKTNGRLNGTCLGGYRCHMWRYNMFSFQTCQRAHSRPSSTTAWAPRSVMCCCLCCCRCPRSGGGHMPSVC